MAIKGLSQTSSLITIGFEATETGPNTFTQARVDLQLNPLDNEVFVVQAVNLDVGEPEGIAATNTSSQASLTSTSLTAIGQLNASTVIATTRHSIRAAGFLDAGVGFESNSMETPPSGLEYIAVISTNDFFVQVVGSGNTAPKSVQGKMYGFRAKASSSVYAALVQSELLSA